MGRLIDADKIIFREIDEIGGEYEPYLGCSKSQINSLPTVEAISKADYKADMVAMLTELQLEIEEIDSRAGYDGNGMPTFANDYVRIKKVNDIIQQKINKLKEK